MKRILILTIAAIALCACCRSQAQTCCPAPVVKPGIEVLRDRGFAGLEGKKVGLLTNPSGVDRNLRSTIDILYKAENVDLVRLFAPEHGVRGDIYAGGHADDTFDEATGLKVYSIYGKFRKPTPEMLEGLYFSNTDNYLAYQYLMAYYILTGDRERYTKLLQHTSNKQ